MKKSTGYQCKQDIINAQAKEIARLQDRINAAEEVINAQQDKIAILEAKLNAKESTRVTTNKASDNNDRIVGPTRYGYSVKDMIAKLIAYEEAQKASKRIVKCK